MGAAAAKQFSKVTYSPSRPDLKEVGEDEDAFVEVAKLLEERSKPYLRHYNKSLRLKKLWRLSSCDALQKPEAEAVNIGKPTQLFHGTSLEKALRITLNGFKLPTKTGMFGRGVYFADCPLKSSNFSPDETMGSLSRIFNDGLWNALFTKKGGHLLLCDVYLGKSKTLRRAATAFNPEEDLKPNWWDQKLQQIGMIKEGDYNSCYVPGGFFGAVNVTEYVVYQEHQGIPKYLIEFEYA
jgi:hypothetical protein